MVSKWFRLCSQSQKTAKKGVSFWNVHSLARRMKSSDLINNLPVATLGDGFSAWSMDVVHHGQNVKWRR